MKCIGQIRRERLQLLMQTHGLSQADLNDRLGRSRRDATLSQILNSAPNTRTGRPREMGSDQARDLERVFSLEEGWMDKDIDFERAEDAMRGLAESSLRVMEPPSQYLTWPFRKLEPTKLTAMPPEQLERLETYMLGFISGLEFSAPDKRR